MGDRHRAKASNARRRGKPRCHQDLRPRHPSPGAGRKLLHRLAPDIVPAAPAEVRRHEKTLKQRFEGTAENEEHRQALIIEYLQLEIRLVLFGSNGPDLSYAFQHGRMEAPQVLATLRQILPDLAGVPSFDEAVFVQLSSIDPNRAAVLLDGLSQQKRFQTIAEGYVNQSSNLDPEASLAWSNLTSTPPSDGGFPISAIAGRSNTRDYHEEFGNDYTEWLLDQPPSKGRELMMEGLMEHLVMEDPVAAVALRKRLSTR